MLKRVLFILLLGISFLGAKTVDAIDIKGFDADKLKPIIGIKVGDTYSAAKVQKAKKIIKEVLGSAGYQKTAVTSSLTDKGTAVGLHFNITKGNKVVIKKIEVIGNSAVSDKELTGSIVNQKAEFMGWFPGRSSGTANITQMKYDAMRVQDEYYKRGYIDAKVPTPSLSVDPVTSEATVTYHVTEGKQYRVASVGLVMSHIPEVTSSVLRTELNLKQGGVFDVSKLRKDIKSISMKLANMGYAYVKVLPGFKKNPRNHTMSVRYKVVPGTRVTIENVLIKGNKKTKDNVIRRYVDIAPGDVYNFDSIKESKKALSRTGFFEETVIKPKKISAKKMNLEVDVKEAKTGAFTFGGGYGSADGWMLDASLKERNFMGTGIEVGATIGYSKVTKSYNLFFKDPRFLDSKYSLSGGIFRSESDYTDNDTYDTQAYEKKNEFGGYFSVGHQFTSNFYASIGYSYKDVEYDWIRGDYGSYLPYVKSSIIASMVYDNTDDYYTPREGVYAKLNFEYAGFGSAPAGKELADFSRIDAKFATYYGFKDKIDYDLILRLKMRGSYINRDNGKFVPVAERLYLGGASRGVRGFKSGTISPVDGEYRVGGYRSYATSIEASVPLSVKSKMRLTFFVDYGQIGIDKFDITQKSVGAQIEWRSPFGPINLIFAKAIDPDKAHGDTSSFEFNIGGRF